MSSIIVIMFKNQEDGQKSRAALKDLQKQGLLNMEDAAVLVKDEQGKMHIKNEVDRDVMIGAGVGGLLGVLLMFMFPIAGLALGAAGGALVGKSIGAGIDKKFVKDVTEHLEPGHSAVIAIMNAYNATTLVSAIRPFEGELYESTLDSDLEQELRDALK